MKSRLRAGPNCKGLAPLASGSGPRGSTLPPDETPHRERQQVALAFILGRERQPRPGGPDERGLFRFALVPLADALFLHHLFEIADRELDRLRLLEGEQGVTGDRSAVDALAARQLGLAAADDEVPAFDRVIFSVRVFLPVEK